MSISNSLVTTRPTVSRLLLLAISTPAFAQMSPQSQGGAQGLYIEPRNGQSEQQQWSDRYACHNWAKSQSGFDPTRPSAGAGTSEQAVSGRDEYRRAMTACLEARGYSVRYAGGAAAPPPPAPVAPIPGAPPAAGGRPASAPPPAWSAHRYDNQLRWHAFTMRIDGGYTLTEGDVKSALNDGSNVGLGFTLYPIPHVPFGIRIDGSYNRFDESAQSRSAVSAATGTDVAFGREEVYGGDADAEIDLPMGPRAREYFFGGFGWYRERTDFKQLSYQPGEICWGYCWQAEFPVLSTVERSTSPWHKSWNAGMGFEFALADPMSFFIEARYLRIEPYSSNTGFVPIRVGLKF